MIHIPTPRASGHCPGIAHVDLDLGSQLGFTKMSRWILVTDITIVRICHIHDDMIYIYIWDDIRKIWYTIIWYLLSMVYAVDIRKIWYDICKIWYTTLLLYGLYSMLYAVWYMIYDDVWYFIWGDMMWYGWYYMKWYDIHIYL